MCILKEAEPKNRGSVIRSAEQTLVQGEKQTGRPRGAMAANLARHRGFWPQARCRLMLTLSKSKLPVPAPSPVV